MASSKDLRKRISSVKNTQAITRAMKMVSAAKLRRAQENIVRLRPYAFELGKVLMTLAKSNGAELSHPLLNPREVELGVQKAVLVVVISSDRGLCGAFNGNIIKSTARFLRESSKNYKKIDLAFIGKKGFEYFRNRKPGKYHQGFYDGLNFGKAKDLATELIQVYLNGEYDEIKIIYNEFKSALSQKVNVEAFLPVPSNPSIKGDGDVGTVSTSKPTIFEPNANTILEQLLPRHFATQIYRALLESLASEHGARMAAMENATRNAGEMIRKLTLVYNKTRQAGITKELLEITAGSEAQK